MKLPFSPALLEPLENRIAPAGVFVTYTDVDGDLVKITASKGPLDLTDLTLAGGDAGQLQTLNLTDAAFDGAKITFTVTKKPGGDGLANVGFINATGRDLDAVTVKGDLGRIVAGDPNTQNTPGLKSLKVRSLGNFGTLTGAPSIDSIISGPLGRLTVARDFAYANLAVKGGTTGTIGSIFIGGDLSGGFGSNPIPFVGRISSEGAIGSITILGDLRGGLQPDTGSIVSLGSIGAVKIGGDVTGGSADRTGVVTSGGTLGAVTIGGNVTGGAGQASGRIFSAGDMGPVKLGGGLVGGSNQNSGQIVSTGGIAGVKIRESLVGGTDDGAGSIQSTGDISFIALGGSLIGGNAVIGDALTAAGSISIGGAVKTIAIKGSIIAGTYANGASGTSVNFTGSIQAGDSIGSLSVGRSLVGNYLQSVVILARGLDTKPGSGDDLAIGRITVKGDVHLALILAGFTNGLAVTAANADASIGSVKVGGDWAGSSLVAGAQDAGAVGFGVGDTLQTVNNTGLIARIASVTIGGDASGIPGFNRNYGFVAERIDALKVGGLSAVLDPGNKDNFFFENSPNLSLLEV